MEFKDMQSTGRVKQMIRDLQKFTDYTYAGSESELSVRGASTEDVSCLSVASGGEDLESFVAASFAGDADECVRDPCAICFTNPRKRGVYATHFCSECGLLGHFLCGECLSFHKKFTKHTDVRSLLVASKRKDRLKVNSREKEAENEREKHVTETQEVTEKSTQTEYNVLTDILKETENEHKTVRQELTEKNTQMEYKVLTDIPTEVENEHKTVRQELTEKNTQIKELECSLQEANVQLKLLRFKLQLTEDTK